MAVGHLFRALFNWQVGFVNRILTALGLLQEPMNWLGTPGYTKPLIAVMITWQSIGYAIVMIMAGLRSISREMFDAARIDGAGRIVVFRRIAVPLVRPVITFLVITLMIWGLQLFDEPFLLYGPSGGSAYSALTMVSYLYISAFVDGYSGYGSALGYILAVAIIITTLLLGRVLGWKRRLNW